MSHPLHDAFELFRELTDAVGEKKQEAVRKCVYRVIKDILFKSRLGDPVVVEFGQLLDDPFRKLGWERGLRADAVIDGTVHNLVAATLCVGNRYDQAIACSERQFAERFKRVKSPPGKVMIATASYIRQYARILARRKHASQPVGDPAEQWQGLFGNINPLSGRPGIDGKSKDQLSAGLAELRRLDTELTDSEFAVVCNMYVPYAAKKLQPRNLLKSLSGMSSEFESMLSGIESLSFVRSCLGDTAYDFFQHDWVQQSARNTSFWTVLTSAVWPEDSNLSGYTAVLLRKGPSIPDPSFSIESILGQLLNAVEYALAQKAQEEDLDKFVSAVLVVVLSGPSITDGAVSALCRLVMYIAENTSGPFPLTILVLREFLAKDFPASSGTLRDLVKQLQARQ
jgi:hypothetical protein